METAFILIVCIVILHIVIVLCRTSRLQQTFTVEEFRQRRIFLKKTPESSQTENLHAISILSAVEWESGFEMHRYQSSNSRNYKMQILTAETAVNKVIVLLPTDPRVIEILNRISREVNFATARIYTGSKTVLIFSFLVAVIAGAVGKSWFVFFLILLSGLLYMLTGWRPRYLANFNPVRSTENPVLLGIYRLVQSMLVPLIALFNYLRYYVLYV